MLVLQYWWRPGRAFTLSSMTEGNLENSSATPATLASFASQAIAASRGPLVSRRSARPARACLGAIAAVLLAMTLGSTPAHAASKDAEAQQLADEAIFTDYLRLDFKAAEKKLKRALALCANKKNTCTPTVYAQVHRDLAVIYITGLKRPAEGKKLLIKALELDPRIALDADLTTPELVRTFSEAKEEVAGKSEPEAAAAPATSEPEPEPRRAAPEPAAPAPEPEPQPEPPPEKPVGSVDCPPDFPGCESLEAGEARQKAEEEAAAEAADKRIKNWLSVSLQQDFLMFGQESGVCQTGAPEGLSCFRADDVYRDPRSQTIGTPGTGGEISGGFGLATTRLLLGYDRLLTANISAGARVGYAIGGGPAEPDGAAFIPFHAELRGNYWFGTQPFEHKKIRSFVNLGAGLAQVDASVSAEVIDQEIGGAGRVQRSRVDVWKKTGTLFAALGVGGMYPLTENSGIVAELRAMLLLPSSGTTIALQAGYTYGF
jgi:hypothetical protein